MGGISKGGDGVAMSLTYNDNGEPVGSYQEVRGALLEEKALAEDEDRAEDVAELGELLAELESYKDYNCLLVATEHNGMGWGIEKVE